MCVHKQLQASQIVWAYTLPQNANLSLYGILSPWRKGKSEIKNQGKGERDKEQVILLPPSFSGCLGYGQLGLLATTKQRKTQQNPVGRQAGRQVVNGGRNCYLSHWQEQRKCSPECWRENLYLPVFSILQLNSFLQFPVGWSLQRDFSMHCSNFYTCKVACYVIKQVWDNCWEALGGYNFVALQQGKTNLVSHIIDVLRIFWNS